jgi:hypothetical protein
MAHRGIVIENAYATRLCGHGISTGYQSECRSNHTILGSAAAMAPWYHAARALRPTFCATLTSSATEAVAVLRKASLPPGYYLMRLRSL